MIGYDIIIRPLVSEKSMESVKTLKYVFEVHVAATKPQIKAAVEQAFNVKVKSVNTVNVRGKEKVVGGRKGRERDWKKAYVQLTKDSKPIEFFESLQ